MFLDRLSVLRVATLYKENSQKLTNIDEKKGDQYDLKLKKIQVLFEKLQNQL